MSQVMAEKHQALKRKHLKSSEHLCDKRYCLNSLQVTMNKTRFLLYFQAEQIEPDKLRH